MAERVKDKKYYWIKLKSDFFERPEIKFVEAMPEGKDYILFYMKLLCKSIDHEGKLRFNDNIPYNSNMLSVVTNTKEEIIEKAIEVFTSLQMMELLDDGTYFMREVEKMMGSETYWAQKKREYKARDDAKKYEVGKIQTISNNIGESQTNSNSSKEEREIDLEKDLYKEREIEGGALSPHDEGFIDWAWEEIKSAYPRKDGIEASKPKFLEIMEQTPEADEHTIKILCVAMTLYGKDHDKKNPDDAGVYKYALGLKNWFNTEYLKWIEEAEQLERISLEAEKRKADNEGSLVFDSESLEKLSSEEKEELVVCGALVMRETDALVYPKKMHFETRENLVIRGVLPSW